MDDDDSRRQLAADVTPAEWDRIRASLKRARQRPPHRTLAERLAEAKPRDSDYPGGPVAPW